MKFFFDENISKNMAYILRLYDLENTMIASSDEFDQGTPDIDWLKEVSKWGDDVVVVSTDANILKNKVEKPVLKECGLPFVCLAKNWSTLPWQVQVLKLLKAWPDIVKTITSKKQPCLVEVTVNGKVKDKGLIRNL